MSENVTKHLSNLLVSIEKRQKHHSPPAAPYSLTSPDKSITEFSRVPPLKDEFYSRCLMLLTMCRDPNCTVDKQLLLF